MFRWNSIVLSPENKRSAISLLVFPSFIRPATCISVGVSPTYFEERLTEKGEMSEKEGKELIDELLKKSEQARKDLETRVENTVRKVLEKMAVATKEDIDSLSERIKNLEQKEK